ncbi:MAG: GumC family protein [Pseudorhodobacter sp.]
MGPVQTLDDFIGLLFRRRLLIAVVTILGIILSVLYALSKAHVFESTAVIQVRSPTVVDPTSGSLVPSQSAQRLQSIEQQLMTRDNMLEVIERYKLYAGLPWTPEEKVAALRQTLRFDRVTSAAATQPGIAAPVSALLISVQADTRTKAAQIANDFAERILDEGTEVRTGQARESARFFSRQQADLETEIERQELALVAFKSKHAALLPAQRGMRVQEIIGLDTEIRMLYQSLLAARNIRDGVIRRGGDRVTDQRRLETLDEEIDTLLAQREALLSRREEVQAILAEGPEIDRQIAEAERGLSQLSSQLNVTTQRLAEANTAVEVEQQEQGETFALLERAVEPDHAIGRPRRQLAAVGAFASFLFGIAVAFLLDFVKPVIRSPAQMERELGLIPVAVIPTLAEIEKTEENRRQAVRRGSSQSSGRTDPVAAKPAFSLSPGAAVLGRVGAVVLVVLGILMT